MPVTLSSQITVAISLLATLAAAMLVGFAVLAAFKVDGTALEKERTLVRQGLSSLTAALSREQESVSRWNEAVSRTAVRDRDWMEENLGHWMHRFFGHDRIYVLDTRDQLIFAADEGRAVEPAAFDLDEAAAREMAGRVRSQLSNRHGLGNAMEPVERFDIAAGDVHEIDGRPAIVSARPIIPHSDRISLPEGAEYILVSVRFLDGATLNDVADASLIADLAYVPSKTAAATRGSLLCEADADSGCFTWQADRPGVTLLGQVAPWAVLALGVALCVWTYQARVLRRASTELQVSEARARHLALHDVLTGLPNRALFEERLDAILADVRQRHGEAALLFLDLDRFKNVNDTLGHRAGDELMRQAAARLEEALEGSGTAARLGGDEFAIVIAAERALKPAEALSERLLAALTAPFHLGEDIVHIGVSIGVATAPAAGLCRHELLRKADIALYEAKKRGRGRHQVFSASMDDIVKQRQRVEADLRRALAKGEELELVYQPLYSDTGELTGAEALLRWNHPIHKTISPGFLVTIAEECGLIVPIGDRVLDEACRMAARVPVPWIAVNVSPVQLRDAGFARRCLDVIALHGIAPERIQIEVTEAVVIDTPEVTAATLQALREAGVRVALDDFGTGYSSMSYLRDYPLDRLKIDRVFVQALGKGEEGRAIVAAMIEMARALKLEVTAEGVETDEQYDILKALGCKEMQGYLFSRPVSGTAFAGRFLQAAKAQRASW